MRKRNKRKDKLFFIIIGLIVISIGIFILLRQFNDNLVFFYTPSELSALQGVNQDKIIRVGGVVQPNSIKKKGNKVEFVIADYEAILHVTYEGIVPMLFKEGQAAVAKGKMYKDDKESYFIASEILAKHDEYYMPKQLEGKTNIKKPKNIRIN